MASRRQLRAEPPGGPGGIPERLTGFRQEDWPPPGPRAEAKRLRTFDEGFRNGVARHFARRRFHDAQREWAAVHGMTVSELWHAINAISGGG
jgi:hypothetical protein